MSLRVLAFDLDDSVLSGRLIGTTERQLEYVKHLGGMWVIIRSPGYSGPNPLRISDRLHYHASAASTWPGFLRDGYKIGKRISADSGINLILAQEPFVTGLIGFLLRARLDIPLVVDLHAEFFSSQSGWRNQSLRNRFLDRLGICVVRKADGVRAVSQSIAATAMASGVREERVFACPMPLNPKVVMYEDRREGSAKQSVGGVGRATRLLFVGRFVCQKNLKMLLRAVRDLTLLGHEVTLTLVGDGEKRLPLARLAEELGISSVIHFTGWCSPEETASYYRNSDILVLSSTFEGLPRVLTEAALHGLPVVATDVDGCREVVVHGETGLLVPSEDRAALVSATARLIRSPSERRLFGETARRLARERFDPDRIIRETVAFWNTVANGG